MTRSSPSRTSRRKRSTPITSPSAQAVKRSQSTASRHDAKLERAQSARTDSENILGKKYLKANVHRSGVANKRLSGLGKDAGSDENQRRNEEDGDNLKLVEDVSMTDGTHASEDAHHTQDVYEEWSASVDGPKNVHPERYEAQSAGERTHDVSSRCEREQETSQGNGIPTPLGMAHHVVQNGDKTSVSVMLVCCFVPLKYLPSIQVVDDTAADGFSQRMFHGCLSMIIL